jgi:hypothetical protein
MYMMKIVALSCASVLMREMMKEREGEYVCEKMWCVCVLCVCVVCVTLCMTQLCVLTITYYVLYVCVLHFFIEQVSRHIDVERIYKQRRK